MRLYWPRMQTMSTYANYCSTQALNSTRYWMVLLKRFKQPHTEAVNGYASLCSMLVLI
jgi:hypothetical protein